ncbi:Hypothetical predicted protein [Pelobates cultripes]|uniref:Uncharacterized protein n=1 Tax=Pelobates cultripes TaxID=61616 RepID=A0AAD1T8Q6_PELCU|nr:Hypothetical predicted protein [Pelobates cultripes]
MQPLEMAQNVADARAGLYAPTVCFRVHCCDLGAECPCLYHRRKLEAWACGPCKTPPFCFSLGLRSNCCQKLARLLFSLASRSQCAYLGPWKHSHSAMLGELQ